MNGLNEKKLIKLIGWALEEDFGASGDVTSRATVPAERTGEARILAKQDLIVAGLPVSRAVFEQVNADIKVDWLCEDGDLLENGSVIGLLRGSLRAILEAERTALNFLQRLSGIATLTNHYVKAVRGTRARILDTRKTTPTLREMEKYAVRAGGGYNHRFGLYDMILIKDNHIDAAGGLDKAVEQCLVNMRAGGQKLDIEVETRNLDEVKQALLFPINRIMLDNMNLEMMKAAVELIACRIETEASGNVSLKTVRAIAETGVDFISIGALTHSVESADISLRLQ